MYVSLLFWLGLVLPGYVLVRRLAVDELRSGLLGTLALSYVAVLGLLSPVSILCYLLKAPLGVFSSACALAFVAALFELTRRRWWGELGKLVIAAASVELAIIILDLLLGVRVGAFLEGDARVHMARIRLLLDHGFSNYDPYIAAHHFFPTYHTNILHALYAACAQITGVDHLGVWFTSLAWGKLLTASGIYYLVWCIFGRQWAAWLAAVCMVGIHGPISFIIYPNKLAPLWLIPCMIGFAVQAVQTPSRWSSCIKLGIGALLLGQMHGLYAIFAVLLLAPVLAAVGVIRIFGRRPDRWRLAVCVLALAAGLPFPVVSKLTMVARSSSAAFTTSATAGHGAFVRSEGGWIRMDFRRGFGAGGWRFALLGLGIAGAMVSSRRKQAGCLVAVLVIAAAALYAPPICTILVRALGREWILGRLEFVLRLGAVALLVPVAAFWLEPKVRLWWVRGLISIGLLPCAIVFAGHDKPYTWTVYRSHALAAQPERQAKLIEFRAVRRFLKNHLPAGETVLADPERGMYWVAFYDCYIVAAGSSNNGVGDLAQRQADLSAMLAEDTPWPVRRGLLGKYGVRYFVPQHSDANAWVQGRVRRAWRQGDEVLLLLKTD